MRDDPCPVPLRFCFILFIAASGSACGEGWPMCKLSPVFRRRLSSGPTWSIGWYGESVIVYTAAAKWWTDSIAVIIFATDWMLPKLLGMSFSANEPS